MDYFTWIMTYDNADIIKKEVDLKDIKWDRCYTSDMKRAVITANEIYDGEIINTHLLREVQIHPAVETEEKQSYDFWKEKGRIAWESGDISQIEDRETSIKRVKLFLDFLEATENEDSNILLVFHVILMREFEKELKLRGYTGEFTEDPLNGKLYLFEK